MRLILAADRKAPILLGNTIELMLLQYSTAQTAAESVSNGNSVFRPKLLCKVKVNPEFYFKVCCKIFKGTVHGAEEGGIYIISEICWLLIHEKKIFATPEQNVFLYTFFSLAN